MVITLEILGSSLVESTRS